MRSHPSFLYSVSTYLYQKHTHSKHSMWELTWPIKRNYGNKDENASMYFIVQHCPFQSKAPSKWSSIKSISKLAKRLIFWIDPSKREMRMTLALSVCTVLFTTVKVFERESFSEAVKPPFSEKWKMSDITEFEGCKMNCQNNSNLQTYRKWSFWSSINFNVQRI